MQEKHAEQAETLALFRRYVFGPRRERLADNPGQGHLFDLHDATLTVEAAVTPETDANASGDPTQAARPKRRSSKSKSTSCSKCRDGVTSPPVPPKSVPGGIAGPGLVSKFAVRLPLYEVASFEASEAAVHFRIARKS
ncbi:hypothetical protein V5E97_00355 [Singulisphaera sp. Ch08]|uniref:Transposase TnpC homeodomain domain-containing protein n=1 Tax=Singulisphaera sp. Ch08 TaxID=3120278 RepID=A0AAU7CH62_9BACT